MIAIFESKVVIVILTNNPPQVNPENVLLITILLEDWLKALLESFDRGLTCAKEGESRELKCEKIKKHC